jgi:hypothetical protein
MKLNKQIIFSIVLVQGFILPSSLCHMIMKLTAQFMDKNYEFPLIIETAATEYELYIENINERSHQKIVIRRELKLAMKTRTDTILIPKNEPRIFTTKNASFGICTKNLKELKEWILSGGKQNFNLSVAVERLLSESIRLVISPSQLTGLKYRKVERQDLREPEINDNEIDIQALPKKTLRKRLKSSVIHLFDKRDGAKTKMNTNAKMLIEKEFPISFFLKVSGKGNLGVVIPNIIGIEFEFKVFIPFNGEKDKKYLTTVADLKMFKDEMTIDSYSRKGSDSSLVDDTLSEDIKIEGIQ